MQPMQVFDALNDGFSAGLLSIRASMENAARLRNVNACIDAYNRLRRQYSELVKAFNHNLDVIDELEAENARLRYRNLRAKG